MATDTEVAPGPDEYASYYQGYVGRVPRGGIVSVLGAQLEATRHLLASIPAARATHAYAPGKWTIAEVLGHVVDTERIFAYRLLRIARGDRTPLPGFDQDEYVPAGAFNDRSLSDLAEEYTAVRNATLRLLRGMPEAAWERRGSASGWPVSVRALAWIIAGHELHHTAILRERYLTGVAGPPPDAWGRGT
jgi:uncharacterized damage-inducible protein DinB